MKHLIRSFVLGLALLLSSASLVSAQGSALFSVRGPLAQSYQGAYYYEGIVYTSEGSAIVNCPPGASGCISTMQSLVGGCSRSAGDILSAGPHTGVYFVASSLNGKWCGGASTFFVTGYLNHYTPSSQSQYGVAEFRLDVDGYTLRFICDPLYGNACENTIQQRLGQCIAAYGDIEAVTIGFLGETYTRHWTTIIYTNQQCN